MAFRTLLHTMPGITVVTEAADGRQAVEAARRTRPDVVLMDVRATTLTRSGPAGPLRTRWTAPSASPAHPTSGTVSAVTTTGGRLCGRPASRAADPARRGARTGGAQDRGTVGRPDA